MRQKLSQGEVPFRKAYLGSIVDRVEVHDGLIRMLLKMRSQAKAGLQGVRSFVRKGRAVRDRDENYIYAIAL
jgi:hypothetical protein